MKKKIFGALSLALILGLFLTSCGPEEQEQEENANETDDSGLSSIVLPEEEEEEEIIFEYDYSGEEAVLIAYHGELEEVILDETVIRMKSEKQTKVVTEEVTAEDGTVTTVEKEVEETVEVPVEYTLVGVEAGVFMNNETVKKIVLPDSVLTVGEACFQGCTALEEVVLPASLETIPDRLFYACDSLTSVNIPETVTSVGLYAFGDFFKQAPWYNNLPAGSVIVGDGVLLKYNGTDTTVTYGDEVKTVAYYAFMDTPVQSVYFTDATESISDQAFYRTDATVMLPEGSSLVTTLRMSNVKVETYSLSVDPTAEESEDANTEENSAEAETVVE